MYIYRTINGETHKIELSEDEIIAILEERQTKLSIDTQFGKLSAAIGGEPSLYPEIFVYLERPDGVEIDLVAAGTEKDSNKMNAIPKGELSKELRDIIINETSIVSTKETKQQEEVTESYVSSSPDFVPSQQNNNYRNNRRNKNKKK